MPACSAAAPMLVVPPAYKLSRETDDSLVPEVGS